MFTSEEIVNSNNRKVAATMIRSNMLDNDQWLIRGLLAVYNNQTIDEKNSHSTKYHNKIGFNGLDAEILTSFAQQVLRWKSQRTAGTARFNRPLSDKQMNIVRTKMLKYAGQLVLIVQANTATNTATNTKDTANAN